MIDIHQFSNFREAAEKTLAFLHHRYAFDLWMVTRVSGEDWIMLETVANDYGMETGQVFNWTDSFCSRMVAGDGPRIAPRSRDVDAYACAPIGEKLTIGAYIGIPLADRDGSLFGTLCAIDPQEHPEISDEDLPLLELISSLLSMVLGREMESMQNQRQAERFRSDSMTDVLTGLSNRRGWDAYLDAEEQRARQFADPIFVTIVDLDELKKVNDGAGHAAGDELLKTASQTLRATIRETDIAARIGGDEFAVAGVMTSRMSCQEVSRSLRESLAQAGVRASVGTALRAPDSDLARTWALADRRMYAQKRAAPVLRA
ncbi:MAG: sensor domain-containing diguanylate cyclase [Wenzhouxiangellaceae bacterium]|nr:sensor domain-containing diguanylate cyclase [Wenzhouxiangellaceae bacterium]